MLFRSAQRQARPTALDDLEQTDGDNVLCPRVLGLILFGGMIEELVASVNFPARLGSEKYFMWEKSACCDDLTEYPGYSCQKSLLLSIWYGHPKPFSGKVSSFFGVNTQKEKLFIA